MKGKSIIAGLASVIAALLIHPAFGASQALLASNPPNINLGLNAALMGAIPAPPDDALLDASGNPVLDANGQPVSDPNEAFHKVIPNVYDPFHTHLVQSTWLDGIGCPTGANIEFFGPLPPYPLTAGSYTDPACTTGDPKDSHNEGLLMVKTGPTNNDAAAVAELKKVRGSPVNELGYDIRKKGGSGSALGSHCGAGAPRFNVYTTDGLWGVGCSSPPADSEALGDGFTRLRWGVGGVVMGYKDFAVLSPITGTVTRIVIVFDEGYDTGGDFFGGAILDNIDFNGALVGRGQGGPGVKEDSSTDNDDDD